MLPQTGAELLQMGLGSDVVAAIWQLVKEGNAESDVVRAFLAALMPWAGPHVSRHLRRALRNVFRTPDECADLRRAVAAIVGTPSVAAIE